MRNYMKSEWYRVTRGKGFYLAFAVMAGLVLGLNLVLAVMMMGDPQYKYATVRFSLNTFTAQGFLVIAMGAVIPGVLTIDDRRNGVLKNAAGYGISREKILMGKCVVSFLLSFVLLLGVLAVYVGSAFLLLREPEWLPLQEMLLCILSNLPSAVGSLILMQVLGILCKKEMTTVLIWTVVYYIVPTVFRLAGFQYPLLKNVADWMPYNVLNPVMVTFSEYHCIWDTPEGFGKLMLMGAAAIVIFLGFGLWRIRKQEF